MAQAKVVAKSVDILINIENRLNSIRSVIMRLHRANVWIPRPNRRNQSAFKYGDKGPL